MERFYSFSSPSEEELFFDSKDDLSISSDSSPESPTNQTSDENLSSLYQVWLSDSESIQQRRENFTRLMGLDLNPIHESKPEFESSPEPPNEESTSNEESISVRNPTNPDSDSEKPCSDEETISSSSGSLSTKSSLFRWSSDKRSSTTSATSDASTASDAAFDWLIRDMDSDTVFFIDKLTRCGNLNNSSYLDKSGSLNSLENLMKTDEMEYSTKNALKKDNKTSWLRRLGFKTQALENQPKFGSAREERIFSRVRMKTNKKNRREFSELYSCQDFRAHDNSAILTLKFSPCNKYLATGGEMGILRVWSVADREREDEIEFDSSCVYFEIGENYDIAQLSVEKKESKLKWHNGNLTCVLVPKRVFWIEEEPVQDFKGHFGDILDLSWSKSNYLISASVDKTVRLWQIGCENCLKIFSHQNFVTCVQFNPSNEDYFVSGSIDGIIRIWQVPLGHVVNWIESKEIVTAVCYQPDGNKVVVGTITGQCRYYDVSDNQLVLKDEVSHQGKKKSPHKRITGFEFCPCDSSKLMIASADSQVRILQGSELITSYKGAKNHASHVCASFSTTGEHIISCTDDSIYLLNWTPPVPSNTSFERFTSHHTSLAIPFNGARFADLSKFVSVQEELHGNRGSGTWPEEKLTPGGGMSKSQYKVLKSACQNGTDMWGQVVVTAGWDGRLRSYQNFGLPVQV
ncbi:hypothetical protein LUZ60_014699 [Juncus effusus]|nr:hypothetical protein LUZ60_014699 [Juncus effusus]